MKKFPLVLLVLVASITYSQNKINYGIKAGLNFSEFRGDLSNTSVRPGFALGGIVNYKINNKFAIQPEVSYSSEGTHYSTFTSGDESSVYNQYSLNLGYIVVPVMIEYYLSKVSFEFGPQVSFLTYASMHTNTKATLGDVTVADAYSTKVKDQYNNIDFGLNFGVGYNFTPNFAGNLRYNLGLIDVYNTSSINANYNSVITLSFGYIFK